MDTNLKLLTRNPWNTLCCAYCSSSTTIIGSPSVILSNRKNNISKGSSSNQKDSQIPPYFADGAFSCTIPTGSPFERRCCRPRIRPFEGEFLSVRRLTNILHFADAGSSCTTPTGSPSETRRCPTRSMASKPRGSICRYSTRLLWRRARTSGTPLNATSEGAPWIAFRLTRVPYPSTLP
jgi:hypothetical protein